MHGFTCGFGDLLLVPKSEKSRRNKLKETDDLGNKINARFVGVDEEGGNLSIHVQITCSNKHFFDAEELEPLVITEQE